jgi:DNA-binding CsgD family transcriptional regulator
MRELDFISHDRHGHRRATREAPVKVFPNSRPRSSTRGEIMASLDRSYPTSVEPHGRNFSYLTPWLPARRNDFGPAPRTADPIPEPAALARATAEVRLALEQAAIAAEEAAAYARAVANVLTSLSDRAIPATASKAPCAETPLSPREREVLSLVAEGRTNKAIADALSVSPNTIKTHVASLLTKLNADSRVQLATIAARLEFC